MYNVKCSSLYSVFFIDFYCNVVPHKQVNEMYEGKVAIHVAVMESYLPIVRLLIKYTADLDLKVSSLESCDIVVQFPTSIIIIKCNKERSKAIYFLSFLAVVNLQL